MSMPTFSSAGSAAVVTPDQSGLEASGNVSRPVSGVQWGIAACAFALYFGMWWQHLRPGVFSFDSGYYLNEVLTRHVTNLKPFFFARFLQAATLGGKYLQLAAFVQGAIAVFALSRMLAIGLATRVRLHWIVLCVVVLLNPYVANMVFFVENDVLFSIAVVVIIVETMYIARLGVATKASWLVIAIFAPMALLFRQNGILFLPPWIALVLLALPRRTWPAMLLPAAVSCALALATSVGVAREGPSENQDLLYPAVIHEVVNLARPQFGQPLASRLSTRTWAVVGRQKLQLAVTNYMPLYWDTIAFFPAGPKLVDESPLARQAIVRSFVRNDLAHNLPAVSAHRLEVFLGAALAQGVLIDPYYAPTNLSPRLFKSKSANGSAASNTLLGRVNRAAIETRLWSWNAVFGMAVLAFLSLLALWRRDVRLLAFTLLLWLQVGAVLLAAPAAEYRYLFPIYLAPLMLLVGSGRQRVAPATQGVAAA